MSNADRVKTVVGRIFDKRDTDKSGYLSFKEFNLFARKLDDSISPEDLLANLDTSEDGNISKDELETYFLTSDYSNTAGLIRAYILLKGCKRGTALTKAMVLEGLKEYGTETKLETIKKQVEALDPANGGSICLEDFKKLTIDDATLTIKMKMEKAKDCYIKAFERQDADKNGYLSVEEITKIGNWLDRSITVEDLHKALDTNNDNKVSKEEFGIYMSTPDYCSQTKLPRTYDILKGMDKNANLTKEMVYSGLEENGTDIKLESVKKQVEALDPNDEGSIEKKDFMKLKIEGTTK